MLRLTYLLPLTPLTMAHCLIGYHHGLAYMGQPYHGSGHILLIAFNALQYGLFCLMHGSSYTVYHRVRFLDPYCSDSILLPFLLSLPNTPILGFIFMLMIPNYMYTSHIEMLSQLLNDSMIVGFWLLKIPAFKVKTNFSSEHTWYSCETCQYCKKPWGMV